MKKILIAATILCTVILLIPTVLVQLTPNSQTMVDTRHVQSGVTEHLNEEESDMIVTVFRSQSEQIEEVDLEKYVAGVVASEMPAQFEIEALKAQALAARTYIVKQMLHPADIQLPSGAMVTDSVMHQVYHNDEELRQLWKDDYSWKKDKIEQAVLATKGQVITYNGEPITASFFSTSNGYTENSEDYWQNEIPYLRSVASPWDESSPRFASSKQMTIQEFEQRLGVKIDGSQIGKIESRTDGGRVAKVTVSGKTLSGREVRDRLELDSSDFDWKVNGKNVVIESSI